jgi:hypothetical protein
MRLILPAVCLWLLALGEVVSAGEPSQDTVTPEGNPDPNELLKQVVVDLLTNPDLKSAREFYGTPGDKDIALRTDSPIAWPADWRPKVPGYDIRFRPAANRLLDFIYWHVPWGVEIYSYIKLKTPRLLGVSLNKLHLDVQRDHDDQICVSLFNIGGDGGKTPVIGACIVYYKLKRDQRKWSVEFAGCLDP